MRTRRLAAVLTLGALALTGCGSDLGSPGAAGAAAVVGDEEISLDTVDDFAEVYCEFQTPALQQSEQKAPMMVFRSAGLDVLVQEEVARQYAEAHDLEPGPVYNQLMAEVPTQAQSGGVPQAVLGPFTEYMKVANYTEAVYILAGEAQLGEGVEPQGAADEGHAAVTEWAADLAVARDPRFAAITADQKFEPDAGSLSLAVSDPAKLSIGEGDQAKSNAYIASLPADQVCG